MANWWWLTPEGARTMLDPAREYSQEKGIAEAVAATQPGLNRAIYDECVRAGVKCEGKDESADGSPRNPLYENMAFHLWRMKKRGLVDCKKAGGQDDRRKRRDSAAAAATVEEALGRAAVEPIAKDRLLTAVRGPEAADALDRMVADGRIVAFARTGKLMAAKDI